MTVDNNDIHTSTSVNVRKTPPTSDFVHGKVEEPHAERRKRLLEKHPDIADLFGPDWRQAIFTVATLAVSISSAYFVKDWSLGPYLLACYFISGTCNHSLMLALHELGHDNFFESHGANMWFSFIANVPIGFAMASTFRRYHHIHHAYMGTPMVDMDLPTKWEAQFFSNALGRLVWLFLQSLFYALRPLLLKPLPLSRWEVFNWTIQLIFDGLVYYYWGPYALLYFVLGTFLGTGIHPMSGHFFEHLETVLGQETYSYYGPLNLLTYNVGYHNEHHDFPKIPGSRLPELKRRFPQLYDSIPHYNSWTRVLFEFVLKGNTNLYCRTIRKTK